MSNADNSPITTKDNILYAIVLACAHDAVTIHSLSALSEIPRKIISDITLVGNSASLAWPQDEEGLIVHLPHEMPCEHAFVLKLHLRELAI